MNHLEFAALESAALKEGPWDQWLDDVQNLSGIQNLDGDDDEDGYSLDQCFIWFRADVTPEEAARRIKTRRTELGHVD